MPNYSPFPPYIYLCQCADHIPETMRTYLLLWKAYHKNPIQDTRISYSRDTIENINFIEWDKFEKDIRSLAYEGLLDFEFLNPDEIAVTLYEDYSINAEGYALC